LAGELIALKPDLLLGIGLACRAMAAKTSKIPIVITSTNDPLRLGLVKSIARPGTNVTGMSNFLLLDKQVELLLEVAHSLKRVVLINDATSPSAPTFERMARTAADEKKKQFVSIDVKPTPESIRAAFAQAALTRDSGIVAADTTPIHAVSAVIAEESL